MLAPTIEEIMAQDIESLRDCPEDMQCRACDKEVCVKVTSISDFPSEFGRFNIIGFVNNRDYKEHIIIQKGEMGEGEDVLVRIHSACLTGDALGSMRCDCGTQLKESLKLIEKAGRGVVVYHQEEGRGIGLLNKLRAYALQDQGYDTWDANVQLGFAADERDYEIPVEMLKKIGVKSVRLLTNNPEKVEAVEKYGLKVSERIQHEIPPHRHNHKYLETKKERFGHFLHLDT